MVLNVWSYSQNDSNGSNNQHLKSHIEVASDEDNSSSVSSLNSSQITNHMQSPAIDKCYSVNSSQIFNQESDNNLPSAPLYSLAPRRSSPFHAFGSFVASELDSITDTNAAHELKLKLQLVLVNGMIDIFNKAKGDVTVASFQHPKQSDSAAICRTESHESNKKSKLSKRNRGRRQTRQDVKQTLGFISLWKAHEFLWNRNVPEFNDRELVAQKKKEIARLTNRRVDECNKLWNNLYSRFNVIFFAMAFILI